MAKKKADTTKDDAVDQMSTENKEEKRPNRSASITTVAATYHRRRHRSAMAAGLSQPTLSLVSASPSKLPTMDGQTKIIVSGRKIPS
ncbi:hypothetical protein R6Q59_012568 [Mikania micrantha]